MFLYFGICESHFSHEKGSYNKERVYNDLLSFLIGIDLSFLFDSVMKLRLTWISITAAACIYGSADRDQLPEGKVERQRSPDLAFGKRK